MTVDVLFKMRDIANIYHVFISEENKLAWNEILNGVNILSNFGFE